MVADLSGTADLPSPWHRQTDSGAMGDERARAELASARAALEASGRKTRLLAHRMRVMHGGGNGQDIPLVEHVHALKAFVRARERGAQNAAGALQLDAQIRDVIKASFDNLAGTSSETVQIGRLRAYMQENEVPAAVLKRFKKIPHDEEFTWTELRKTLENLRAGLTRPEPLEPLRGGLSEPCRALITQVFKSCQDLRAPSDDKSEEEKEQEEPADADAARDEYASDFENEKDPAVAAAADKKPAKKKSGKRNAKEIKSKHVSLSEFCARLNRHEGFRAFSRVPLFAAHAKVEEFRGVDEAADFVFEVLGAAMHPQALRGARREQAVCRVLSTKLEKKLGRSVAAFQVDLRDRFEKADPSFCGALSRRKTRSILAEVGVPLSPESDAYLERFCISNASGHVGAVDYYAFLNLGLGVSLKLRSAMRAPAHGSLQKMLKAGCEHPCSATSRTAAHRRIQHFTETEKLTRAVLRLIEAYPGGPPNPRPP